ncbi:MAG: diguanylate cyclase [Thermodesulfobacteriota bacterium]
MKGIKVLVAEDDRTSRRILESNLAKWGYNVTAVSDGAGALEQLHGNDGPQIAVLDWLMPGMDGVEVCRAVRKKEKERYTYIILLTAVSESAKIVKGMNSGADDYVVKPYKMEELKVRLNAGRRIIELQGELIEAKNRLQKLSMTDPLTGILNRRALYDRMNSEMSRAEREKGEMSIAIMDVDLFKRINDRYGHLAGDAVLKGLVERISEALRPYDTVGRFGGEEFLVVLPGNAGEDARKICERVRRAIKSAPFTYEGAKMDITVSIGGAAWSAGTEANALISAADGALYRAKEEGRDRVVLA